MVGRVEPPRWLGVGPGAEGIVSGPSAAQGASTGRDLHAARAGKQESGLGSQCSEGPMTLLTCWPSSHFCSRNQIHGGFLNRAALLSRHPQPGAEPRRGLSRGGGCAMPGSRLRPWGHRGQGALSPLLLLKTTVKPASRSRASYPIEQRLAVRAGQGSKQRMGSGCQKAGPAGGC